MGLSVGTMGTLYIPNPVDYRHRRLASGVCAKHDTLYFESARAILDKSFHGTWKSLCKRSAKYRNLSSSSLLGGSLCFHSLSQFSPCLWRDCVFVFYSAGKHQKNAGANPPSSSSIRIRRIEMQETSMEGDLS